MGPAFLPRRKQTEAKHPKKESPSLLSAVKCLVLPHLTPVPGRCWAGWQHSRARSVESGPPRARPWLHHTQRDRPEQLMDSSVPQFPCL